MSSARALTAGAEQGSIGVDGAMKSPAPSSGPSLEPAGRTTPAAASPWLPSTPAIDLAIEALPLIADGTAAKIVAELALTLVDQLEELTALRTTLSVALKQLADQEAKKKFEREQKERARGCRTNHIGAGR